MRLRRRWITVSSLSALAALLVAVPAQLSAASQAPASAGSASATATKQPVAVGTGGAVTWDSTPEGEWDETELKARRLISVASGAAALEPAG